MEKKVKGMSSHYKIISDGFPISCTLSENDSVEKTFGIDEDYCTLTRVP